MIGADEFNARTSQSTSQSAGDISDIEFIETMLTSRSTQSEIGFLIDIVCPQPPSQQKRRMTGKDDQVSANITEQGRN